MKNRNSNTANAKSNPRQGQSSARSTVSSKGDAIFEGLVPGPEVGVLLVDENKQIVTANDVSAAVFGWQDLAGRPINTILKGGLNNEFGRILQQKDQPEEGTQRYSFQTMALSKRGPEFPVSVILTRNSVGTKTWWTALFRKLDASESQASDDHQDMFRGATDELQRHVMTMAEESSSFREEIEVLQQERDNLVAKLEETQVVNAELESKLVEKTERLQELEGSLEESRNQLQKTETNRAVKEESFQQEVAQNERLKEELLALRQMCDDLTEKLTAEQLACTEGGIRIAELEQQLAAKPDVDPAWEEKLRQAEARAQQAEASRQEEADRNQSLVKEIADLHQSIGELQSTWDAQQTAAAEALQRQDELEEQLREKSELADRLQAEADQSRLEGDQEDWVRDLHRLRELEGTFLAERTDLENRLHDSIANLARATTELEKERKERRRIEQRSASVTEQLQNMHEEQRRLLESERSTQERIFDLEEQLRDKESAVARIQGELRDEIAGRELAEEQLHAAGDMASQVENYRTLFEESKETFKRSREELEAKLQQARQGLQEAESHLRQEQAKRQELQDKVSSLEQQHDASAMEVSRLQNELNMERLERKQLEGDAANSRYASLDSARANRAQASSMKRQIRQPVERLLQSSRQLLDTDLAEPQRALAESLLENSMYVQTCLQDAASGQASAASDPAPVQEPGTANLANPDQAQAA